MGHDFAIKAFTANTLSLEIGTGSKGRNIPVLERLHPASKHVRIKRVNRIY